MALSRFRGVKIDNGDVMVQVVVHVTLKPQDSFGRFF